MDIECLCENCGHEHHCDDECKSCANDICITCKCVHCSEEDAE